MVENGELRRDSPILEQTQVIKDLLMTFLQDKEKVDLWLETPNPNFGYMEPGYMIRLRQGKKVLDFIKQALDENKS